MTKRRVVITGMGAITPIGLSAAESWKNAKAGVCGIGHALLGIGMLWMLWRVRGAVSAAEKQPERFQ